MPCRISLVVGADGGIGRALVTALRTQGDEVHATTRRTEASGGRMPLDMSGDVSGFAPPAGLERAFLCAAVTATALCRQDPAGTARVNVENTVCLARRLASCGAFVVFPSTNLVFDGNNSPSRADDPVCPRLEYGRQKAQAEEELLGLGDQAAVVRLTKVLTPDMALLAGWAEDLRAGRDIRPFDDMFMAPVSLGFAIRALLAIANARRGGVWQVSASRDVSYADAAMWLADRIGAPRRLVCPVSWRNTMPHLEHVPQHTCLDASRLGEAFGFVAPEPFAALDEVCGEIL